MGSGNFIESVVTPEVSMNQLKKPLPRDRIIAGQAQAAPAAMATDTNSDAGASRLAGTDAAPEPEPLWQSSSFDLRSGADITDFSDTIPADLFDRLFRG